MLAIPSADNRKRLQFFFEANMTAAEIFDPLLRWTCLSHLDCSVCALPSLVSGKVVLHHGRLAALTSFTVLCFSRDLRCGPFSAGFCLLATGIFWKARRSSCHSSCMALQQLAHECVETVCSSKGQGLLDGSGARHLGLCFPTELLAWKSKSSLAFRHEKELPGSLVESMCRAQSVTAKSLSSATTKGSASSSAASLVNGKGPAGEEVTIDTTPVLESFVPWLSDQVCRCHGCFSMGIRNRDKSLSHLH